MRNDIVGLVPVTLETKGIARQGYIGKVDIVPIITSHDKKLKLECNNNRWAKYIQDAINNYHVVESRSVKGGIKPTSDMIANFVLLGKPLPISESRTITKKDDEYIIAYSKEYNSWVRDMSERRPAIVKGKAHLLPIKYPVIVECVYYMHRSRKKTSLVELISSTLNILDKLRIIYTQGDTVVNSVNGSKICYTNGIEYTSVSIRAVD